MEAALTIGLVVTIGLVLVVIGSIIVGVVARVKRDKQTSKTREQHGSAWTGHHYLTQCKARDLHGAQCIYPLHHRGPHKWTMLEAYDDYEER